MSELPKLRSGSRWVIGRNDEIEDASGDVIRILGNIIQIESEEGTQYAYVTDVLALLDANGQNTTANELRKELNEAREKLLRVEYALRNLQPIIDTTKFEPLVLAIDNALKPVAMYGAGVGYAREMIGDAIK